MKKIALPHEPLNWDLIVKIVGLVALLASGWWTIFKFREDRQTDLLHEQQQEKLASEQAFEVRNKELNAFVFQKQEDLFFEAVRMASIIADSDKHSEVAVANDRFKQLFYGELVVVEDRRIELAMIAFLNCERALAKHSPCTRAPVRQDGKPLNDDVEESGNPSLQNLSLDLAACVRKALYDNRGIRFSNKVNPRTACPYD